MCIYIYICNMNWRNILIINTTVLIENVTCNMFRNVLDEGICTFRNVSQKRFSNHDGTTCFPFELALKVSRFMLNVDGKIIFREELR